MTDDAGTTPPPPPAAPGPRRLTRSRHDRIVAGVAGGAGRYFDVDPVVFRIAFVVAYFIEGAGLFAYLAAWLLIPEDDPGPPSRSDPGSDLRQRAPLFWVGVALLAVAGLVLADEFDFWTTGWLLPLLLIGVGFALWRSGRRDPGDADTSEDPSDLDETVPAAGDAVAADGDQPPAPPHRAAVTAPLAERTTRLPADRARRGLRRPRSRSRRRRERSYLGRLTIGVLLIVSGVAGALDDAGVLDVTIGEVLAVDLAIVGLGLVAGAWFGRSRGLILLGIVLTPVMLFANVVGDLPWVPGGGAGERTVVVTELAQLEDTYELGAGELRLDLSRLQLDGAEADVTVRVGTGEVLVVLPAGAGYDIDASVRIGQVDLPGGGLDQGLGATGSASARGDGTVHLDVTVGVGRAHVETATIPAQEG